LNIIAKHGIKEAHGVIGKDDPPALASLVSGMDSHPHNIRLMVVLVLFKLGDTEEDLFHKAAHKAYSDRLFFFINHWPTRLPKKLQDIRVQCRSTPPCR
jgi:hypothetical protein